MISLTTTVVKCFAYFWNKIKCYPLPVAYIAQSLLKDDKYLLFKEINKEITAVSIKQKQLFKTFAQENSSNRINCIDHSQHSWLETFVTLFATSFFFPVKLPKLQNLINPVSLNSCFSRPFLTREKRNISNVFHTNISSVKKR